MNKAATKHNKSPGIREKVFPWAAILLSTAGVSYAGAQGAKIVGNSIGGGGAGTLKLEQRLEYPDTSPAEINADPRNKIMHITVNNPRAGEQTIVDQADPGLLRSNLPGAAATRSVVESEITNQTPDGSGNVELGQTYRVEVVRPHTVPVAVKK